MGRYRFSGNYDRIGLYKFNQKRFGTRRAASDPIIFIFQMINHKLQNHLAGIITAFNGDPGNVEDLGVNLTIQGVFAIITGLICWFTRFALVLIVAAIIVYGIQFITSQGNPEKYNKAKSSLTWGIVGIVVILGTYTIIATVANFLGANYNPIPLSCSSY